MAWSNVANNQMVSYFDASTSGIPLLSGQSHFTTLPAANQCMTKANMQAKYNLNATNLNPYASNQLVPKSAWATAVTSYFVPVSYSQFSTATLACAELGFSGMGGLYKATSAPVGNGTVLYQNAGLTILFPGIGYFQIIDGMIGRLSNVGVVSEYQGCSLISQTIYRSVGSAVDPDVDHPACVYYSNFPATYPLYCNHSMNHLTNGDILYTNAGRTTPFNGGFLYYGLTDIPNSSSGWSGALWQISTTGVVTLVGDCGF
jgi:hypothetical protein